MVNAEDSGHSSGNSGQYVDTLSRTLIVGDEEYDFGHEIFSHLETEECIVLLFDVASSRHDTQPVIEDLERNVVGVDYDGIRLWRIDRPPHEFPTEEYRRDDVEEDAFHAGSYYRLLMEIDGVVHVRHTNKYRYQLDPETGALVDHEPDNTLAIGDRVRSFGAPVRSVLTFEDRIVVLLQVWDRSYLDYSPDEDLDPDDDVYCFDGDGSLVWSKSGGYLSMHVVDHPGTRDRVRLMEDPRLGERVVVDVETGSTDVV